MAAAAADTGRTVETGQGKFRADAFAQYLSPSIDDAGRRYFSASTVLDILHLELLPQKDTKAMGFGRSFHEFCEYELCGQSYYILTNTDRKKHNKSVEASGIPIISDAPAEVAKLNNMRKYSAPYWDTVAAAAASTELILEQGLYVPVNLAGAAGSMSSLCRFLEVLGRPLKIRVDAYNPDTAVLYDWKTVTASTRGKIQSEMHWRKYWLKMAIYYYALTVAGYPCKKLVLAMFPKWAEGGRVYEFTADTSDKRFWDYINNFLMSREQWRRRIELYNKLHSAKGVYAEKFEDGDYR